MKHLIAVAQKTRFKPTIEVKTVGAAIPLRLTSQVVWRHAGFFFYRIYSMIIISLVFKYFTLYKLNELFPEQA